MKKLIFALFFLLPACALADAAPDVVIRDTANEVIALIKADKASSNSNIKKLAETVDAKVMPHFNFMHMTKLAVGKDWNGASSEQQQALTREFHTLLVRTYSSALENYRNQVLEVMPLGKVDGNLATVKSRVVQPGKPPVPIDYRMEKLSDGWKVFDVSVDGVSLVTNYRSEFAADVSSGGIDGLIRKLSDKNKKGDSEKPAQAKK